MTAASYNDREVASVAYPRDATISALFANRAAATPDKIAIVENERSVSYRALDERACALAARLQAEGVGPGDIVALLAERSIETVAAMLAVLKLGGVFTPLDPAYPADRLALMLKDAEPKALLVQNSCAKALEGLDFPRARVMFLDDTKSGQNAAFRAHDGQAEDGAYLIYTSGSTGAPKGVLVPHRGLIRAVWRNRFAQFDDSTVALHVTALSFDPSQLEIWGALLNGGAIAIVPDTTPSLDAISAAIKRHRVTWTSLTTGIFHLMVDHHLADLAGVKAIFVGGDVLSAPHADRAARALPGVQIVNAYGPTENSIVTCCFNVPKSGWSGASLPIGEAVDHVRVHILDQDLQPVADGEEGELCASGDGLAIGYHKRPDLNAEKFVTLPQTGERVYRTGDMVRRRADGMIEFLGRRDRQVKVNGKRVELDEIEFAVRADEDVLDAVVILREDAPGVRRVAAYVIPAPQRDGPHFVRNVLDRLRARVPAHMVPSDLIALQHFPLTPAGKVDRAAMPSPRVNVAQQPVLQDSLERQLAEIWCAVLGLQHVEPTDRFFDLGGTSLMLMKVQAMIAEKLFPAIQQTVLFEAPTIRELAARLRQGGRIDVSGRAQNHAAALARARRMHPAQRGSHG